MTIVEQLRAVQEHDCRIRELEKEAHDVPARKEQELARLNTHREELAEAENNLKAGQAALHDLELENESHEEEIRKLRQQQMEIKTNREFKAMEHEIAAVQEKISALEDRELELMEQLDARRKDVAEKKTALEEEDELVQRDVGELDERLAGIHAELETERGARQAAAAQVTDKALLAKYDGLMRNKDRALAPLDGAVCGGCHMRLPPSVGHDIQRDDQVVTCGYCGRILYRG